MECPRVYRRFRRLVGYRYSYLIEARRAFNEVNTRIKECSASSKALTCSYCSLEQPPRSKHCQECDKCVLQLDHHCVSRGTCIGQNNHCRFWWYICTETALCLWTGILYIGYLSFNNISRTWWEDVIIILLLCGLLIILVFLLLLLFFHSYLVLTNQTTYELVRRRRITYLRGIPERVYPLLKGIRQNLYRFCSARGSNYYTDSVDSALFIVAQRTAAD